LQGSENSRAGSFSLSRSPRIPAQFWNFVTTFGIFEHHSIFLIGKLIHTFFMFLFNALGTESSSETEAVGD